MHSDLNKQHKHTRVCTKCAHNFNTKTKCAHGQHTHTPKSIRLPLMGTFNANVVPELEVLYFMHAVLGSIQNQPHIALTVARLCLKTFAIIAHNQEGLEMLVDRVPQ